MQIICKYLKRGVQGNVLIQCLYEQVRATESLQCLIVLMMHGLRFQTREGFFNIITYTAFGVVPVVSILTLMTWQSDMTKFQAIIIALGITPFPHKVWSPASSASSGIELTTPILEVAHTNPLSIHHRRAFGVYLMLIASCIWVQST